MPSKPKTHLDGSVQRSPEDEQEISHNVAVALSNPRWRYGADKLDAVSVLEQGIAELRWEIRYRRRPRGKRLDSWTGREISGRERQIRLREEAVRRLQEAGLSAERPWIEGEPPLLLVRLRELEEAARTAQRKASDPKAFFHHTLAIHFSPAYLAENADGIRQDWPRIPLPDSKAALLASAELGRQVAALLDTESPVPGVTSGKLRPELAGIAELQSRGTPDFRVTAGWGHAGKGGVTMPGKGKLETRGYQPEETAALGVGQASRLSPASEKPEKSETGVTPVPSLLGPATHDIYLNDTAYWCNVPEKVWDFTLGGYQVLKKWLSYREHDLLGRALTADEAREVMHTARRLAALILLQPELDANYQRAKEHSFPWTA